MQKNREIYKKVLYLAIPMMIQNGITNAVGLVDNLMVGSLGTESMTAVSIAGQLIFVFNLAIFGGLSGPGIYGAQYFGQGNKEGFQYVFRLKYWIGIIAAIAGIAIFYFFGTNLIGLYLHGNDADVDGALTLAFALKYLRIMLLGLIPFVITQIYAGSLRETGESVIPMVGGVVSVVVDVVFNYLLIYGKFGFPELGVEGAAIATVLARVVELCVVIIWTHVTIKRHEFISGVYKTLRVPIGKMMIVVKKGLPLFANEFMWAGGMAAITQCYSIRGLSVVAGMNISNAICNVLNVVFITMGNAVGIITGQYLGASRFKDAKKNATKLMWFTAAVCVILTVVLIGLSTVFPNLYDTTDEVRELGRRFIIVNALFFPLQGFLNSMYFTLRSGGRTFITFVFDSVFTWCVSVSMTYVFCVYTDFPIIAIFVMIQSLDFIKVIIGYILIKKEVWITNLVEE